VGGVAGWRSARRGGGGAAGLVFGGRGKGRGRERARAKAVLGSGILTVPVRRRSGVREPGDRRGHVRGNVRHDELVHRDAELRQVPAQRAGARGRGSDAETDPRAHICAETYGPRAAASTGTASSLALAAATRTSASLKCAYLHKPRGCARARNACARARVRQLLRIVGPRGGAGDDPARHHVCLEGLHARDLSRSSRGKRCPARQRKASTRMRAFALRAWAACRRGAVALHARCHVVCCASEPCGSPRAHAWLPTVLESGHPAV
jgi:hypothetical protein